MNPNYWLELGVRSNNAGSFSILMPRQPVTPAPYAVHAIESATIGGLSASDLNNTIATRIAAATNSLSTVVQAGSVNLTNWSARTTNSFVPANGGVLTNVTLSTGNATASFSNPGTAHWPTFLFDATTNTYLYLSFTATGQAGPGTNVGVQMNYWPQHNFTQPQVASEFVLTADGSIALGAHWFQIGVGAWMPAFMEFFDQQVNQSNTNLFDSIPLVFRARYFSNGVSYASGSGVGGPGRSDTQYEAALHYRALDTNGNGGFGFYNALNNNQHNGTWSHIGSSMQHQFVVGPDPGLQVTGYIQANGLRGITTNKIMGNEVWQITDGLITSIAPIDQDMLHFISQLGPVSPTVTNAMITFVATLKASGIWTNLDFLYPMIGTNIDADCVNLVSDSFRGIPHGTFVVADASGVKSDGVSGCIDTQWRGTNTPNNCGIFVYLKSDSSVPNYATPIGTHATGSAVAWIRHANSPAWAVNLNDYSPAIFVAPFAYPASVLVQRVSATSRKAYLNGNLANLATDVALTPPPYNLFVCSDNINGTAGDFFNGQIQIVAGFCALSDPQVTILHTACAALNLALGR